MLFEELCEETTTTTTTTTLPVEERQTTSAHTYSPLQDRWRQHSFSWTLEEDTLQEEEEEVLGFRGLASGARMMVTAMTEVMMR